MRRLPETRSPRRSAGLWLAAVVLVGWSGGCQAETAVGEPGRPVLFVHGSGMDSSTWQPMISALQRAGYPREYLLAVDIVPADADNVLAAERFIAPAVDRLLDQARSVAARADKPVPERIDIVAHSMGAVSSRWYAARLAPQRVRVWIGIAGANHGTNALCGMDGEGNRQMCPAYAASSRSHPLQVTLNGTRRQRVDETPYGRGDDPSGVPRIGPDAQRSILYYTVRLPRDRWIEPARSAELAGAGGVEPRGEWSSDFLERPAGNFLLRDTRAEHDPLPADSRVIELVAAMLRAGDVASPQTGPAR